MWVLEGTSSAYGIVELREAAITNDESQIASIAYGWQRRGLTVTVHDLSEQVHK